MIHTNLPRNCMVFLLLCELTRLAIYDSHKRPTVLVDEVKGKPCNFEACLCGSLYSTFTTSFNPCAFYNKRFSNTSSTDPRVRERFSDHDFAKKLCASASLSRSCALTAMYTFKTLWIRYHLVNTTLAVRFPVSRRTSTHTNLRVTFP